MSRKSDDVRYCHSDIRLNMSVVTLYQLQQMIALALRFARMVEGENSFEFKTALHWKNQLKSACDLFDSSNSSNSDIVTPISPIMRTFYD